MNALLAWCADHMGFRTHAKPLPAPEPLTHTGRPMTGIVSTMSAEQFAAAMAYDGPVAHGESFRG